MPKISEGQFALGFLALVTVWLLVVLPLLYRPAQQAPQVHARQQTNSALKGTENSRSGAQDTAATNKENSGEHPEQGEDQGTEFWPSFFGLKLKITDSLLAAFTLGLLIFTGLLWKSTDKLWKATIDTIQLGQREFVSTHRPKLILRQAFAPLPVEDTPIFIQFTISNIGESRAWIVESVFVVELFRQTALVVIPAADGAMQLDTGRRSGIIEPGENRVFAHSPPLAWDVDTRRSYAEHDRGLFFSGHIVYIDDNSVRRQTAFRRKYDPGTERFYRIPGHAEEHDYAD
jgi:hypothetical protein